MDWRNIKYYLKQREIYPFLLILLVFTMPLRLQILPHLLLAMIFSWFFTKNLKKKIISALNKRTFQLILIFVGLHVLGLAFTTNFLEGLKTLEIRISLVIIPLVILAGRDFFQKNQNRLISAFIWGNLIGAIICFSSALFKAYNNASEGEYLNFAVYSVHREWSFQKLFASGYSYLNYTYFSVLIHANYFSMYIVLSIYLLYRQTLRYFYTTRKLSFLNICLIIFLLIVIFLLQSRAAILSFFAAIIFEIVYNFTQPGFRKLKIAITFIFIVGSIFVLIKSERFNSIFQPKKDVSYEHLKSDNLRLRIWEEAMPLIKENWMFGVGTGDLNDEFKKIYSEELYKLSGNKYHNFHNEFLETWGRNGIFTLLLLIFLLFSPFFYKRNYKGNRVLLVFCIILIINFTFESMLVRLNGVLFFALFYSLFHINITHPSPTKNPNSLG